MMNDVWHLPFPNDLHGVSSDDALAALGPAVQGRYRPARVAAIIVEPVQGEGGFTRCPRLHAAPARRLRPVRHPLIADEVQTGFARTGKLFAMEHHGVADPDQRPRGLGGALPASAPSPAGPRSWTAPIPVARIWRGMPATRAGGRGHPCFDVIEDERLCSRATRLWPWLKQRRTASPRRCRKSPISVGPGFRNAVEFNVAGGDKQSIWPAASQKGAQTQPDPADLWRLRQCHPLPRTADHPG